MNARLLVLVGATIVSGLFFTQCGAATKCDATTCKTGCCSADNLCQTGVIDSACGTGGSACQTCSAGLACQAQMCTATGSTGGGAGGGGGGGGLDAGSCKVVSFPASSEVGAVGYSPESSMSDAYSYILLGTPGATSGRLDVLDLSLWYFGSTQLTTPLSRALAPSTIAQCDVCLAFNENCDVSQDPIVCDHSYLSVSGQVEVPVASRDFSNGHFQASGSNVRLVEWDNAADAPKADGGCAIIERFSFDAGWVGRDAG